MRAAVALVDADGVKGGDFFDCFYILRLLHFDEAKEGIPVDTVFIGLWSQVQGPILTRI